MIKSGTGGLPVPRLVYEPQMRTPEPDPDELKGLSPKELEELQARVQRAVDAWKGPRHPLLEPQGRELLLRIGRNSLFLLPAHAAKQLSDADVRGLGLAVLRARMGTLTGKALSLATVFVIIAPLLKRAKAQDIQELATKTIEQRGAEMERDLDELMAILNKKGSHRSKDSTAFP